MADVTRRMLDLLTLLQTKRRFTGPELVTRLGVSERTVRRDIDRLREYGYPVDASPGPGGHYGLTAGRAVPPHVRTGRGRRDHARPRGDGERRPG